MKAWAPNSLRYLSNHVVAPLQRGSPHLDKYLFQVVAALEPKTKAWFSKRVRVMPSRHLPRLLPMAYRGRQIVHWTMTVVDRRTGWLTSGFHIFVGDLLQQLSEKYYVVIPTYCLMPDHMHLLAAGIAEDSDQLRWAKAARRAINLEMAPYSLQKQAFDHVLRTDERGRDVFVTLVNYILENPVRTGLVEKLEQWKYSGSCIPWQHDSDAKNLGFSELWWSYWTSLE